MAYFIKVKFDDMSVKKGAALLRGRPLTRAIVRTMITTGP